MSSYITMAFCMDDRGVRRQMMDKDRAGRVCDAREPRAEEEEEEEEEVVMAVRAKAYGGRGSTLCCLNMQHSGRRALLPTTCPTRRPTM